MPLTALDIYKQLPKTNCGECGSPTCLAFAMQLASKKVSLDQCPYVSDEAKANLEGASAPPIKLVKIGTGDNTLEIGNETVLFRHEETFYHPTGLAILVEDSLSEEELKAKAEKINSLSFERVGQIIKVNLIAVKDTSNDPQKFAQAVKTVASNTDLPLILVSFDPAVISAALPNCTDGKPLIYAATRDNYEEMTELAKQHSCPLAVYADNLDELVDLTPKVSGLGVNDLVIDPGSRKLNKVVMDLTQIRRAALRKRSRPFGYPPIVFTEADGPYQEVAQANSYIAKYAGIVVIRGSEPWEILPMVTMRQNIYTDPQKPIQVEAKVYEIGEVTDKSPLLITTDFSLTYFTVEGDVEASRVPSYILVVSSEGMSVLTAWAAEKFTAENIAAALNDSGIADKISHRKVIIPGYVAVMSGKLEEEAPDWEILVGPRESSAIPSFLKNRWKA